MREDGNYSGGVFGCLASSPSDRRIILIRSPFFGAYKHVHPEYNTRGAEVARCEVPCRGVVRSPRCTGSGCGARVERGFEGFERGKGYLDEGGGEEKGGRFGEEGSIKTRERFKTVATMHIPHPKALKSRGCIGGGGGTRARQSGMTEWLIITHPSVGGQSPRQNIQLWSFKCLHYSLFLWEMNVTIPFSHLILRAKIFLEFHISRDRSQRVAFLFHFCIKFQSVVYVRKAGRNCCDW